MKLLRIKNIFFILTFVLSCDIFNEQVINDSNFSGDPLGIAYDVRMVYTDSSKIKAILTSPKHIDFTNLSLKYSEFPEGVKVVFYDNFKNENIIVADYGILYNNTSIIDLKGNVVLESHDKSILNTSQLYWDADSDWIFTEEKFTFISEDYNVNATRLDTNREFSKFQTGELYGTVTVEEK